MILSNYTFLFENDGECDESVRQRRFLEVFARFVAETPYSEFMADVSKFVAFGVCYPKPQCLVCRPRR